MKRNIMRLFALLSLSVLSIAVNAQSLSEFIVVDQFGYLPNFSKKAVIRNPKTGFDANKSFSPGDNYALVDASTNETVLSGSLSSWNNGATDQSSGDQVWYFDFSSHQTSGQYYILDVNNNVKSATFTISPSVYNDILKHAVRTFFYQRVGFAKESPFAEEGWTDGASHLGPLQDTECRLFNDKDNASTEKDVSGGWYDAGDYNKYTSWTSNYITEMMKAYLESPDSWTDNYNIPESGNDIPDLLDEAKWGTDHILRLQFANGSFVSVIGESHATPPSSATGQSLYGPANTSSTLNAAAALAISAKVYGSIGMNTYADSLETAAINAWNWAEDNPAVLFNNNDAAYNSVGLAAGRQEVDDYNRTMIKLEAASYLFELTGDSKYKNFFDSNYTTSHLLQWNFAYPFETDHQQALLHYANLPNAMQSIANEIKTAFKNSMANGEDNFASVTNAKDPYLSNIQSYTWGSNNTKSKQGNMYMDVIKYDVDLSKENEYMEAALGYVHYIHGVNPLGIVYLSNMAAAGAEKSVNEFYHTWFIDGDSRWDRVGESTYGPAPGFLTGGPNPSYSKDGCCSSSCGSQANTDRCNVISVTPPLGQPDQKSYKDFNSNWPLNSWSVTENSCGYQMSYIKLLSKFVDVTKNFDCNGDENGTAEIDGCGNCTGGNTGLEPEECEDVIDCNGDKNGTAVVDACGNCAGGNTGKPIVESEQQCNDCNGVKNGTATIDACGLCAGGNTGRTPVTDEAKCNDCNGVKNGSAIVDACGNCTGGNTGVTTVSDSEKCEKEIVLALREREYEYKISPIPAKEIINLSSIKDAHHQYSILSLEGKVLMKDQFKSTNASIDIHNLNPGTYFILITSEGNRVTRRFSVK